MLTIKQALKQGFATSEQLRSQGASCDPCNMQYAIDTRTGKEKLVYKILGQKIKANMNNVCEFCGFDIKHCTCSILEV